MNKIMDQLNMIGRKVDIITEGFTKDQIEENIDHFIEQQKQEQDEDKGLLVCIVCTNGSPQSEPVEDNNKFIAMCNGCKDWGEFVYESELEG